MRLPIVHFIQRVAALTDRHDGLVPEALVKALQAEEAHEEVQQPISKTTAHAKRVVQKIFYGKPRD